MSKRNRITIQIDKNNDIVSVCSDRVADVYLIDNHAVVERVYKFSPEFGVVTFGARAVDATLEPPGAAWDREERQPDKVPSKAPPKAPKPRATSI